jgi:hypothetical protein
VNLLGLIEVLQRIEQNIDVLSKELEKKNVENLAQSLRDVVTKIRIIKKMSFFTNSTSKVFKDLAEEIGGIYKHAKEDPSSIFEGLKDFIRSLAEALPITWSKYEKTKTFILFLTTVYTMITMNFVNYSLTVSIAPIAMFVLLILGLIFIITLTLGLTFSLFTMTSIPLTSTIISILDVENFSYSKIIAIVSHGTALALSIIFTSKSAKHYVNVKKSLISIASIVENIVEILKSVEAKISPSINLSMYIEIYGDKVFELVRYIEDMQKIRS